MKLLITGVCGIAGITLAVSLPENKSGLEIIGLDNFTRTGSEHDRTRLLTVAGHGDLKGQSG